MASDTPRVKPEVRAAAIDMVERVMAVADPRRDALLEIIDENAELRTALKEALEGWMRCVGAMPGGESPDWEQINELRKLTEPPEVG